MEERNEERKVNEKEVTTLNDAFHRSSAIIGITLFLETNGLAIDGTRATVIINRRESISGRRFVITVAR